MALLEELEKLQTEGQPETLDELFNQSKEGMMSEKIISQINALLPQMRDNILGQLKTLVVEEIRGQIGAIKVRDGRDGKDGSPGKTPTTQEILSIVKPLIPEIKEKELEIDKVRGLRGLLDDLSNRILRVRSRKGGGGGGSTMRVQNLSSQADSSTRTFTTTYKIGSAHLLFYSGFPSVILPITDYTISGNTITIASAVPAPVAGQSLAFIYEDAT